MSCFDYGKEYRIFKKVRKLIILFQMGNKLLHFLKFRILIFASYFARAKGPGVIMNYYLTIDICHYN
jgi:hypothetical protein